METSVSGLIEQGRHREALATLRSRRSLSLEEQLLLAELVASAGQRSEAVELARSLTSRDGTPSQRVRTLLLLGRLEFFFGRSTSGHAQFQAAKSVASAVNDPHLVSLAIGTQVDCLFHFESFESGLTHLAEFKRAAIRSGRPDDLFLLRTLLAEAELRAGRVHRAAREIELAGVHLQAHPSLTREAQLYFVSAVVSMAMGRYVEACDHTRRAVRLAAEAGATSIEQPGRNNLAHLLVALGRYREASQLVEQLVSLRSQSIDVELLRRSTQLQLASALSDNVAAKQIIDEFGVTALERTSLHANSFNLARASHLLSLGEVAEAAGLAGVVLERVSAGSDRDLLDRTRLISAAASAKLRMPEDALAALEAVALGPLGRAVEMAAGVERVSGYLCEDPVEADGHLVRAARLFGHIGHIAGQTEVLRERQLRMQGNASDSRASSVVRIVDEGAVSRSLLGAAASLLDLGGYPQLLAEELIDIVESAGLGALCQGNADKLDSASQHRRPVIFYTGTEADSPHRVVVTPANDTSARVTLLALQRLVASARELHAAKLADSERSALWPDPPPEQQLGFVCSSEVMVDLMRTTRRVAASPITVLITGETGTGKELLARAVHQCSPRNAAKFIPYNCTAVARDMLESQLFGYRKGAFTGAHDAFPGVIRSAAGGTLFLDEIGEIGLDLQPKLLRFLESNEVHPLGEPAPVTVDVRVVAATNADLDRLMAEGKFRDDLFYRLNVVKLHIPPLRERREEIPLLLEHFLERTLKEAGKTGVRLDESTAEFLLLYAWPGNVRELANEVRRMVALAESGAVVMPEHLSPKIAATRRTVPVAERPLEPTELVVRRDQPLSAAVEHVERALIQDALRATSNVELAAKRLGLSRKGLYLKRQRLKIDD